MLQKFDILTTSLSILHNYFGGQQNYFQICIYLNFRYFNKIILSMHRYVLIVYISYNYYYSVIEFL